MTQQELELAERLRTQLLQIVDHQPHPAVARGQILQESLDEMFELVRREGEKLPDDELSTSDALVPPSDLTLEETAGSSRTRASSRISRPWASRRRRTQGAASRAGRANEQARGYGRPP
jgi:hypothetical protein